MAFWDFLKDANKEKETAKKVFGFISNPVNVITAPGRVTSAALKKTTGIDFNPAKAISDFSARTGQELAKVPETVARSYVRQKVGNTTGRDYSSKVSDPLRKKLYGTDEVQTYQKRREGVEESIKDSRFKNLAGPLSYAVLGLTVAGDLTPGGGSKKEAGEQFIKRLADAGDANTVRKVLGKDTAPELAEALARTKDKNVIKNLIKGGSDIPREVDVNVPLLPKMPESTAIKPMATPEAPELTSTMEDPFTELGTLITGKKAGKGQAPQKGLSAARMEQDALLRQERGRRFTASARAGATAEGSDGYYKELAQLKGEYSKVDNPIANDIDPNEAERIFSAARTKIQEAPDDIFVGLEPRSARLNTQRAVRKALGMEPGLPTKSELKLIRLFSPDLAKEVESITPAHRKIMDAAGVLFGNARSIKSSMDFSMGGRQGIFVAARHPVTWAKANAESVKYAKSADYYNKAMKEIHGDDWGRLIDKYNKSLLTGGRESEEAFAATDLATSKLVKDKLKVGNLVAGSERAYTGGLTKLRKDLLVKTMSAYGDSPDEVEKRLGQKGMEGLLEAVGTLTGRGGKKGGFTDRHATTLQAALFSPKLWASRLQPLNPVFWKRIGPAGRKEAMQSLGAFAAVAGVVLSAAAAAGADVETDPRSSDFLKIKIGDTRYDILGGFQQNLVFGARQLTGETKSSTTGKVTKFGEEYGGPTRLTAAFDVARNKANPILGAGANILEGKDKAGNEVNIPTEIGQLFIPISVQNIFNNAQREEGVKSALKGLPEFVGISSQEYGVQDVKLPDKQENYIKKLESSGAPKEEVEAARRLLQQVKTAPSRENASKDIKEALAAEDLEKAKRLARDYNKRYADSFADWREKYGQYKNKDLVKVYNSKLITAESLRRWAQGIEEGDSL